MPHQEQRNGDADVIGGPRGYYASIGDFVLSGPRASISEARDLRADMADDFAKISGRGACQTWLIHAHREFW